MLPGMFNPMLGISSATFVFNAIGTSTGTSATCPSGVQAGDLLVWFNACQKTGSDPGTTTPTGFTQLTNVLFLSGSNYYRATICYKVASGTEGGTTISGYSVGTATKSANILHFKGPFSNISASGFGGQNSSGGSITNRTVSASGASGVPVMVIACYHDMSGTSVSRTMSPGEDAEINGTTASGNKSFIKYKIYSSSPSDVTCQMGSGGSYKCMHAGYFVGVP